MLPRRTTSGPVVCENVHKEAHVMTDDAKYYKQSWPPGSRTHESVNHSAEEYPAAAGCLCPHQHGRRLLLRVQARHARRRTSTARRNTCTANLAEFDFRYNNRSALGRRGRGAHREAYPGGSKASASPLVPLHRSGPQDGAEAGAAVLSPRRCSLSYSLWWIDLGRQPARRKQIPSKSRSST